MVPKENGSACFTAGNVCDFQRLAFLKAYSFDHGEKLEDMAAVSFPIFNNLLMWVPSVVFSFFHTIKKWPTGFKHYVLISKSGALPFSHYVF